MNTKITNDEIDLLVRQMVDASYKKYGSYSHAAGVLQSITIHLLTYDDGRKERIRDTQIRIINNIIVELENTNG